MFRVFRHVLNFNREVRMEPLICERVPSPTIIGAMVNALLERVLTTLNMWQWFIYWETFLNIFHRISIIFSSWYGGLAFLDSNSEMK